jgi:hypothetical protein
MNPLLLNHDSLGWYQMMTAQIIFSNGKAREKILESRLDTLSVTPRRLWRTGSQKRGAARES